MMFFFWFCLVSVLPRRRYIELLDDLFKAADHLLGTAQDNVLIVSTDQQVIARRKVFYRAQDSVQVPIFDRDNLLHPILCQKRSSARERNQHRRKQLLHNESPF